MNFGDIISSISKYVPSLGARRPKREKEMAADVRPKPLGTPIQSSDMGETVSYKPAPAKKEVYGPPAPTRQTQAPVFSAPAMPPTPFDDGEVITPFKPFDRATLDLRVKKAWAGFKAAYPDVEPSPGVLMAVASHPKIPTNGIHNAFPIEAREAITLEQTEQHFAKTEFDMLRAAMYDSYGLSDKARGIFDAVGINAPNDKERFIGGYGFGQAGYAKPEEVRAYAVGPSGEADQVTLSRGKGGVNTATLFHEFSHDYFNEGIDKESFMKDVQAAAKKDKLVAAILSGVAGDKYGDSHLWIGLAENYRLNPNNIPKSLQPYFAEVFDDERLSAAREQSDQLAWQEWQKATPEELKETFEVDPGLKQDYEQLKKKFEPGTLGRAAGGFVNFAKDQIRPWERTLMRTTLAPGQLVGGKIAESLGGEAQPLRSIIDQEEISAEELYNPKNIASDVAQVGLDVAGGKLIGALGKAGTGQGVKAAAARVAHLTATKAIPAAATAVFANDLYDQYQKGDLGAEDTAEGLITLFGAAYFMKEGAGWLAKSVSPELKDRVYSKLVDEAGNIRLPGGGETPPIHTAVGTGKLRERGVASSIKANIAESLQDELGEVPVYSTMNFDEQSTKAFEFGVKNLDRARRIAIEGAEPPEGLLREAVSLFVENKARRENDVDTLKALMNSPLNKRATEMGQSNAYWAQRGEFSPVKIGIEAENVAVERAKRKVFPWQEKNIEPKIKEQTQKIKETLEGTPLPDDVIQRAIKTAIKKAQEEAAAPEEKLASKVISQVTPAQAKQMTPEQLEAKQVNELVDELFRIAKEKLPEKDKNPAEPIVERIKRMYAQDEEAQRVYETAKEVVKKRIGEKADSGYKEYLLDALEGYDVTPYTRPVAGVTVTKAVKEELKKQGVKLADVVKNRLAIQGATAESVSKGLIEEGFSPAAANYVGALVDGEVATQMGKAKASALTQMTNALGKQIYRPTFEEKISKLTNLGGLGNEDYIELGRAAVGVENVSNEQLRQVSVLSNRLQDAKARMLESDYDLDKRMEYGRTWVAMTKNVQALKNPNAYKGFLEVLKSADYTQPFKHPLKTVKEVGGFAKAVAAGPDISWLFRQGAKLFADSPREYFKVARKSIDASIKTLGGEDALDELVAEVVSRPNFIKGEYRKMGGLDFGVMEEEIPTQLPEKFPIIGRLYKASDAAFEGAQMLARANTADTLLSMAKAEGRELTKDWYKGAGIFVGAVGSRAKLGKLEPVAGYLNNWFFSPRNLKANAQFLTAHLTDPSVPGYLKKRAGKNLLTHVVTTATKLYLAKELFGAVIETDTRSANFGTMRIGSTRVDLTGGMKSIIGLGARAVPWVASVVTKNKDIGVYKSSTTDEMQTRETMPYAKNLESITVDFFRNKEAPMAGVITDLFRGINFEGEEFEIDDELKGLFRPMIVDTAEELDSPDSANKLLMLIAEATGNSVQDYLAPDNPLIKEDKEFQEAMKAVDENGEPVLSAREKFYARFDWRENIRPELERLVGQKNKKAATGWQKFLNEWDERNAALEADEMSPDSDAFPKDVWDAELQKMLDNNPTFAKQYKQIPQELILR